MEEIISSTRLFPREKKKARGERGGKGKRDAAISISEKDRASAESWGKKKSSVTNRNRQAHFVASPREKKRGKGATRKQREKRSVSRET